MKKEPFLAGLLACLCVLFLLAGCTGAQSRPDAGYRHHEEERHTTTYHHGG